MIGAGNRKRDWSSCDKHDENWTNGSFKKKTVDEICVCGGGGENESD